MWHSHLNDMEMYDTKRLIPTGFELGTTLLGLLNSTRLGFRPGIKSSWARRNQSSGFPYKLAENPKRRTITVCLTFISELHHHSWFSSTTFGSGYSHLDFREVMWGMNCSRRRLERVGVRTRITFAFVFEFGHALHLLHELRGVAFTVRMRTTNIIPAGIK